MIERESVWGHLPGGEEVKLYTLENKNGFRIELSNFGASWVSAILQEAGKATNMLLGYREFIGFLEDPNYMGRTIGRFANRIRSGRFLAGNNIFTLDKNDGENCNHGGYNGFHQKVWEACVQDNSVTFSVFSHDGEGGFPGDVKVSVTYSLTDDNCVIITYHGISSTETPLSLTNHAYFNLASSRDVRDQTLTVRSERMLETNDSFIPTGKYRHVENTPFDFRQPVCIGESLQVIEPGAGNFHGLNNYYVFDEDVIHDTATGIGNETLVKEIPDCLNYQSVSPAARLEDSSSSRALDVFTDFPGILVYTSNQIHSDFPDRHGRLLLPYQGICLEAQHFPDSPNHLHFPSCFIGPGRDFRHRTVYRFNH